ncbi:MAG TPA: hypothetical protein VHD90_10870, partial [Phototrophicaceae bacterium]|nr:hypothetical protein [Phototrophicaceae bacterium]
MTEPKSPLGFTPEQFQRMQEMARQAQAVIDRQNDMIVQLQPVMERFQADIARITAQTRQVANLLAPRFDAFSRTMRSLFEVLRPTFEAIGNERNKAGLVEGSGWLPHHTTPFAQMSDVGTPEQVREELSAFYRSNWDVVRAALTDAVSRIDVDVEAKETFEEALRAHERGDYRCAPRLLYPEIERVARQKLKLADFNSRRDLIDNANGLPLGFVLRELSGGLTLLEKLVDHLYARVDDNTLDQVASDPV